ncbi:hypothetical protein [Klebsiella pneumoniae]|uniref:hypothetical protein n=1 Tax=Klebsiella pneumoniae TaxID=573 RepID=UPI002E78E3CD|nr:hypothetical protein [Klebsiella pneumoniae]WVH75991.1 hypothetical protein VST99_09515 [Klebsiella pneumoniae]
MSNQVFEIVQAMSGQGNCITIPGPYLDFFAGDRQQHLLAAILNQLVFWSGKSSLDDGWFYKEHAALAKEVRVLEGDVVRRAIYKITEQYLPGVIQEDTRQVNGTPKKHYRIDQEELMHKIFPAILDSAQTPNRNKSLKEMETAQTPNPISIQILKIQILKQIIKTTRERFLLWITFLNRLRKLSSRKQSFLTLPKQTTWLLMTILTSLRGSGRPSSSCTNAQLSSTALWQNRESRIS